MNTAETIYKDNTYLEKNHDWHENDSDWKYGNIKQILRGISYKTIADVGCGAGKIIENFYADDHTLNLHGFDITENVQQFWLKRAKEIQFHHSDFLTSNFNTDLVLLIDVFEHVEDYYSFLRRLSQKSTYFVFHIPLDLFVLASLTNNYKQKKESVGHLHYFDHNTAIGVLEDTGYKVLKSIFTKSYLQADTKLNNKLKLLRRIGEFLFGVKLNSKILGGYSLMVLCEKS